MKAAAVKGESKIDISQAAASELKDATDEIDRTASPRRPEGRPAVLRQRR